MSAPSARLKKRGYMKILKIICSLSIVIFFCGCMLIPDLPKINTNNLSQDHKLSLASVKQIDTFPFLSMDYYGDADENHLKMIKEGVGIKSTACTTFTSYNDKNEQLLSRNHDWPENPVLILFSHPKNKFSSVSLVDLSMLGYDKKSQFASLKENVNLLYSIYIPMDGMNEKGLAIGAMGCMGIDSKNNNPVVLSTEIIRLVLDNAENVNDAIEIFKKYSIHNIIVPVHYLISDSAGYSVIIEYINDNVEVQDLNKNSKSLTNFKFYGSDDDITNKTNEYLTSGKISKDVYGDSYLRYIKIKQKMIVTNGQLNETESMNLLKDVSMKMKSVYGDFYTVWSVVYNLSSKMVNISVGRNYDKLYTFKLSE